MPDISPLWLSWINPSLYTAWQGRWQRRHVEPIRYLPDHELVVFTRGQCHVEINDHAFDCMPGTFLIVPPNQKHMTVAGAKSVHRYCVHFDWVNHPRTRPHVPCIWQNEPLPRSAVRSAPHWLPRGPMHGQIVDPGAVFALLDTLMARWSAGGTLNRAACRATLLEILLRLFSPLEDRMRTPGRAIDLALRVKLLLDDVRDDRPNLPAVLAPLGYSYEHLGRVFRDAFGATPLAYLNLQRLERAKILLRDPSLSIATIARLAGYHDANYFSRTFRNRVGIPPRQYSQLAAKPQYE